MHDRTRVIFKNLILLKLKGVSGATGKRIQEQFQQVEGYTFSEDGLLMCLVKSRPPGEVGEKHIVMKHLPVSHTVK